MMASPNFALRTEADPRGLLNRYMLPKVAMVVISIAAAVGTVLTTVVASSMGWVGAGGSYAYLMGVGIAFGGLIWRWQVVAPAGRMVGTQDATRYVTREVARFERIELPLGIAALVGLAILTPSYWSVVGAQVAAEHAALFLAYAFLALWAVLAVRRRHGHDTRSVQALSTVTLGLLLVTQAFLQVGHDMPGDVWLFALRSVHLLAFGAWLGGAVWNVFIAVGTAREDLNMTAVIVANAQLERFRWIVRTAFPTIVLTGLLQAQVFLGLNVASLWQTTFGLFVLAKLALVALLLGVFITCPMWHACSPIAGMCDLGDLERDSARSPAL